jgi:bleomycin hydrolase
MNMNKYIKYALAFVFAASTVSVDAQQTKNKATFRDLKTGYYENSILRGIEDFQETKKPEKKRRAFKIDTTGLKFPKSVEAFKTYWKNEPISQGSTSTCWSFSTTSFFETEVYRQTKQQVKISEMYTAYWEYVEKAKYFVQQRGNSFFGEGSEGNAVTRIMKMYGAVPEEAYTGLLPGQSFHTHKAMFQELSAFLEKVKDNNEWNEEFVIATVKSIMNHHMGIPPTTVSIAGKELNPKDYLSNVLKLNTDDYVDVMSLMEKPYWEQCEYEVEDNWWHSKDYYNVPLDVYMQIVKQAIRKGYTLSIGGDTSESGFDSWNNIAVVPSYDIPTEYIDEYARQFRFTNKTTTDDHGMHLIGFTELAGKDWYLIKDSGAGSRNCAKDSKNFGYYFFHEDYIKLKMMDFMVHKDMLKEYMSKFKK